MHLELKHLLRFPSETRRSWHEFELFNFERDKTKEKISLDIRLKRFGSYI